MKSAFVLLSSLAAALAAEWQVLAPNVMTVAFGCSATEKEEIFVSGGDNGGGAIILKSTDQGSSWSELSRDPQLMYLSIDASNDLSVAGALGFYKQVAVGSYSNNGESFEAIPFTPLFSSAQSVATLGKDHLFLVGFWMESLVKGAKDGVMSSSDGGKTLQFHPWDIGTPARYGAFPSNTTWFVTGGMWPADGAERQREEALLGSGPRFLTSRLSVSAREGKAGFSVHGRPEGKSGYVSVVQKTVDGGRTFQTVFNDTGRFYPNGISCISEERCWFVAEGDLGAWVFYSGDAGRSWAEQHFAPAMSLIHIDMSEGGEGWAVGGEFLSNTFNGFFLHTTDFGKTWTQDELMPNTYPNYVSVTPSGRAYATAFLRNGLSSIIGYL